MTDLVPREDLRQSLEEATREYQDQLLKDDQGLTYLESRGITSEARDYFRLGVVRTPLEGHESYHNRLVFPYITKIGVVSMRFRVVGKPYGEQAKLLSLPGDITRLYNVVALGANKNVFICEGETDTIAASMTGAVVVGVPGAKAWHPMARIFSRVFANRHVTVLADNDDKKGEGMDFAKDVYKTLGSCRIVLMPKGHDVSSFVQESGLDEFEKLIARSAPA